MSRSVLSQTGASAPTVIACTPGSHRLQQQAHLVPGGQWRAPAVIHPEIVRGRLPDAVNGA